MEKNTLTYNQVFETLVKEHYVSSNRAIKVITKYLCPVNGEEADGRLTDTLYDPDEVEKLFHRIKYIKSRYINTTGIARRLGYNRTWIMRTIQEHQSEISYVDPPLVSWRSYRLDDVRKFTGRRVYRESYRMLDKYYPLQRIKYNGQEGRVVRTSRNLWLIVFPNGERHTVDTVIQKGGQALDQPTGQHAMLTNHGVAVRFKFSLKELFRDVKLQRIVNFMLNNVPRTAYRFVYLDDKKQMVLAHIRSCHFFVSQEETSLTEVHDFMVNFNRYFAQHGCKITYRKNENGVLVFFKNELQRIVITVNEPTYAFLKKRANEDSQYIGNYIAQHCEETVDSANGLNK